ncbi:MAG: MFS transporter [Clostridia bacterium]|nr:MFS transporter [Clostridia bacterium]
MKLTYKHTLLSCYGCFIIQSIVNNLSPLLFVTYSKEFNVSLDQITLLISYNFIVQMVVDMIGVRYAYRIGYRRGMMIAHSASFLGLTGLAIFTSVMPPFVGLLLATTLCALGSGFIEVLASPIVEALPFGEKSAAMSLLHSFYCWGHIAIVILSTLFFSFVGVENWRILTILWALIPAVNGVLFLFVPLVELQGDIEKQGSFFALFKLKGFPLFLILMVCTGAMEQGLAQWSSLFAETGLGVSKTLGDLLGPCMFGLMMAISRTFYGIRGAKLDLTKFMSVCAVGVLAGYVLCVFAPHPIISLIGCGLAGLFVGIFWPGSLSVASRHIPMGGTTMFAMLAFAGDIGCALGPGLIGFVSERVNSNLGLKAGILSAVIFSASAFIVLRIIRTRDKSQNNVAKM